MKTKKSRVVVRRETYSTNCDGFPEVNFQLYVGDEIISDCTADEAREMAERILELLDVKKGGEA